MTRRSFFASLAAIPAILGGMIWGRRTFSTRKVCGAVRTNAEPVTIFGFPVVEDPDLRMGDNVSPDFTANEIAQLARDIRASYESDVLIPLGKLGKNRFHIG